MRAVMLSIQPKWCKLIADGKKTVEVRKNRPKIATPFKCYIYCTQGFGKNTFNVPISFERIREHYIQTESMVCLNSPIGNCKVIGEFVCDKVYQYASDLFRSTPVQGTDISTEEMASLSCLTPKELYDYEHSAVPKENCICLVGVYGWHISNLVIYDKPKELSAFIGLRKTKFGLEPVKLNRPPQSWCYVEEM